MRDMVEIGMGRTARRTYELDEISIVPSRRTRSSQDVTTAWQLDAYRFEIPIVAHPTDALVSPEFAIELGRLGGLGVLNGEGLIGRHADVAAKIAQPNRMVVSLAGDGCFLMNGQEFATAVQHGANVVIAVIDNGMYGTIRMHQERMYPGRVIATELRNPDFALYARAFGGHGETVEETAEFLPAYERALASGLPSILHVKVDPEAITPTTTMSAIRAQALERAKHAPAPS